MPRAMMKRNENLKNLFAYLQKLVEHYFQSGHIHAISVQEVE
jgi:hypothetical protein